MSTINSIKLGQFKSGRRKTGRYCIINIIFFYSRNVFSEQDFI